MSRLLAFLLATVIPPVASADALEWLQRMSEAVRQSTYEGTAVYRNGDQLESLRIYHRFADGREWERMYSLSGQQREILRQADNVICILPEQKAVLTDDLGLRGLLPKLPRAAFEKLNSHYELIEFTHDARVAGRSCREIHIRARDIYRYSYQVCLDQDTAVPLDIRLIGEGGELLEQVIFTHIEFPASLDSELFEAGVDVSGFRHVSQAAPAAEDARGADAFWEMRDLPAGFRLANREFGHWPGFDSPVLQMLYTDGLASVSVFATAQQIPEAALQGLTRMGGVNAYGIMKDAHHITVVGEVPQATVRFFGDNLQQVSVPVQP